MTTFWEDVKSTARKIGEAFAEAAETSIREQRSEARRKWDEKEVSATERAIASGKYLSRDNPADRQFFLAFREVRDAIHERGQLVSSNTPGDSLAIPALQNKAYRMVRELGSAQSIFTSYKKCLLHPRHEEIQARQHGVGIEHSTVNILRAPGLTVYSVIDQWGNPAFLRFDRGTPARLKALQDTLVPRTPAYSPKIG